MQYTITLIASANMEAHMDVCASSLEEAQRLAVSRAKEGNAEWIYQGVDEPTIEVSE